MIAELIEQSVMDEECLYDKTEIGWLLRKLNEKCTQQANAGNINETREIAKVAATVYGALVYAKNDTTAFGHTVAD